VSDSGSIPQGNSFSNTQILYALSSLTEDQAFQTGSSDIPLLSRSASYAGNTFGAARENAAFRRPQTPYATPSQHSTYSDESPDNSGRLTEATTSSSASGSFDDAGADDFHDCQPDPVTMSASVSKPIPKTTLTPPQAQLPIRQNSLRNVAGRVPKLTKPFANRSREFPVKPMKRTAERDDVSLSYGMERRGNKKSQQGSLDSLKSFFSMFLNFFKLLHYIAMFPDAVRRFFTRPRWSVKGKNILITGASSGIGAEMARQYAAQGARLALIARTTQDLERVADECIELGSSKALFYAADLANPVSTKLAMQQAMADFPKFDVVVLNAGRSQGCYFEEIKDPSQIESMIKLNVNGAITCLHYVLPQVPKTGDSRIVIISNTAGIVAAPYQSVYSATKHALTGFSNSLRIELKNTYGTSSPKICLVSLPEVAGTRCNTGRMDMGAKLPPAKWYSWAGMPLPHAVHDLLPAIAAGKREFGPPRKFNFWRSLYAVCPDWVDYCVMKYIQKTHYRPLDERTNKHSNTKKVTPPSNKSWAC
jgi:NADP-dependent 3-hydroxy acid dehydrogenase YdfG